MKFSCTQENLYQGLNIVNNIAQKSTTLPILNNILFKTQNGKIELSATNLELGINYMLRGKVDHDGSYTFPAKILTEYTNLLPRENIHLEVEEHTLKVESSSTQTKIKGLDANDFPVIPQIKKEFPFFCAIDDFISGLQQVLFAVSTNEMRVELCGVLFRFNTKEKQLYLVATDSYRLAEKKIPYEGKGGDGETDKGEVIVPSRTISEVLRILSTLRKGLYLNDEEGAKVVLYLGENQILFQFNTCEVISRVIEGQFPDYKEIVPSGWKTRVIVNTEDFIKAVKTSSLFAQTGIFDVVLQCKTDALFVSSVNSQIGENTSKITSRHEGDENQIVLNFRYLLDALTNIVTPEVVIELGDSNIPCCFHPVLKNPNDHANYFSLIMPLRQ